VPDLRVTGTLPALEAAAEARLLSEEQHVILRDAWLLASALRNAGALWRGRDVDAVPADLRDADGMGRIVGRAPGTGGSLVEEYLRVARRARQVTEAVFYGSPEPGRSAGERAQRP
jgi:glutamate-ammonia-ligase adenylyltransferase